MKRVLLSIILVAAVISANAQHIIEVQKGKTLPIGVKLTNTAPVTSYDWTETDASNVITNTITGLHTGSIDIQINPAATDGQTATVTVKAINVSCESTTQTATIRVSDPSFLASFVDPDQGLCVGDNSVAQTVNFTIAAAAPSGAALSSFVYYIDANGNGAQDSGENDVNQNISGTSFSIPGALYATSGTRIIVVKSVSGTITGGTLSSPQDGVEHTITVNEKPAITWF